MSAAACPGAWGWKLPPRLRVTASYCGVMGWGHTWVSCFLTVSLPVCKMWTPVVCPPPVCGVSRTEPGTWAVLQMCSRCYFHLVGSWFPVLLLMSSFRLMTPSKSSVPSQLLARRTGHAPPPLPDKPPDKPFPSLLSLAGQKLPGASSKPRKQSGRCGFEPSRRGTSALSQ